MDVDFNNLRKQTAYSLDRVIKTLNRGILPEKDWSSHKQEDGTYKQWEGDILVSSRELQESIDDLRQNVWILLCCQNKEDPDFQCVYEEVEKSGGIERFNDGD